ncbi:MAG: hypothetical protein JNK61_03860 [Bacteroidia bacterium]|mgnify:CR=1 FL=1|nr:hypothetical protein [Bacteroidia bacterium]
MLFASTIILNITVNAQYKTATQSQSVYLDANYNGMSVQVNHSGCDIDRTTSNGVTPVFSATAWTDSPPFIGWNYDDGLGTSTSVTTGIWGFAVNNVDNPDLAIIRQNANKFHIIVPYVDPVNGGVFAAIYEFTPTTLTWSYPVTVTLAGAGVYPTDVNIDADDGNNFAIVWDEIVAGVRKIHVAAGSLQGSPLTPTFCVTNYTLPTFNNTSGTAINPPYFYPDIALYNKVSGSSVAVVSFLTSVGSGANTQSIIMVSKDLNQADFCSSNIAQQNVEVAQYSSTNEAYSNPRIARHRGKSSFDQLGWTTVFEMADRNTGASNIAGITTFQTSSGLYNNGLRVYTNGFAPFFNHPTEFLPNISSHSNTNPVVTFERRSGSDDINEPEVMVIAFDHQNGSNKFPLSFYVQNGHGTPFSSTSQYLYYKVPTNPTGDESIIAVSGTDSRHFLYSWWDKTTYFYYFKIINAKSDLRLATEITSYLKNTTLLISDNYSMPINFPEDYLQLELYSLSGALIGKVNNSGSLNELFTGLKSAMYAARFIGAKNATTVYKLIKQ